MILEKLINVKISELNKKDKKYISGNLEFFDVGFSKKISVPFVEEDVNAGFPSPSENYIQGKLDLNALLIKNPPATFFIRVRGESMINAGINSGDILIVDKSIEAKNNDIIIAVVEGEFTLKRLLLRDNCIILQPENKMFTPIRIDNPDNFEVWGVVTNVIHKLR